MKEPKPGRPRLLAGGCLALLTLALPARAHAEESWKADWSVLEGFSLAIDAEAFDLPTSIAVVHQPGNGAKDPVYFVTELFGKIKVVTRDRSVYTFAEGFFGVHPSIPPPSTWGEIGMAGIALDEEHGYVFASFLYQDANNVMRNGLVRFKSTPKVFGLKAEGMTRFDKLFETETSWINYQIGPMIVDHDTLYVSLGDGGKPWNSQDLHYTTGKVLRMSLDGTPLKDNPFYVDDDPLKSQNLVWALGFRNVFGLSLVDGRMFASENGVQIDRFIEIKRGANYRWDGTDWSLGMNSAMVFGPTVGPVQLAWLPKESAAFPPEHRSRFFLAMSFGQNLTTGIATLDYDFEGGKMASVPRRFLLLKPPEVGYHDFSPTAVIQKVVGVAFDADALYMVVMYPVRKEAGARSAVMRIAYDPAHQHPYVLDKEKAADTLIAKYNCFYCHSRDPEKRKAAPALDDQGLIPRLLKTLHSPEYAAQVAEMNATKADDGFGPLRAKMMQAKGEDRVRLWLKGRLVNPLFDRKAAAMPAFNMNETEAETIADHLIHNHATRAAVSLKTRIKSYLQNAIGMPRHSHSAVAAVLGLALGMVTWGGGGYLRRRRRERGLKS
jgi:hypothetical protein